MRLDAVHATMSRAEDHAQHAGDGTVDVAHLLAALSEADAGPLSRLRTDEPRFVPTAFLPAAVAPDARPMPPPRRRGLFARRPPVPPTTPAVRGALERSLRVALRHGGAPAPEHVLLALLDDDDARAVLAGAGLDPGRLRRHLEAALPSDRSGDG